MILPPLCVSVPGMTTPSVTRTPAEAVDSPRKSNARSPPEPPRPPATNTHTGSFSGSGVMLTTVRDTGSNARCHEMRGYAQNGAVVVSDGAAGAQLTPGVHTPYGRCARSTPKGSLATMRVTSQYEVVYTYQIYIYILVCIYTVLLSIYCILWSIYVCDFATANNHGKRITSCYCCINTTNCVDATI